MSNWLNNWWHSCQFRTALKQGKISLAEQKLKEIEKSGARLSVLEQLFKSKLKTEKYLHVRNQETVSLRKTLQDKLQEVAELESKLNSTKSDSNLLKPNQEFIQFISYLIIFKSRNMTKVKYSVLA